MAIGVVYGTSSHHVRINVSTAPLEISVIIKWVNKQESLFYVKIHPPQAAMLKGKYLPQISMRKIISKDNFQNHFADLKLYYWFLSFKVCH